ncbi:hypothetical protein OROGR_017327 [Orobanche gracilis]
MVARDHHRLTSPTANSAVIPSDKVPPGPSVDGPQPVTAIANIKNKKKKPTLDSETESSGSSNNCSCATSSSQKGIRILKNPKRIRVVPLSTTARRSFGPRDVDALGLPLGMSIAAVVAQVLERKNAAGENMSVDYLSGICILAVRESLGNVFGDKFDNFVTNFEKSFRSTLMTLLLISGSSQNLEKQVKISGFKMCSCSPPNIASSCYKLGNSTCLSESTNNSKTIPSGNITGEQVKGPHPSLDRIKSSSLPSSQSQTCSQTEEIMRTNYLTNQELILCDEKDEHHQFACSDSASSQISMLSSIEKSVVEQTRSNDLKTFEIGLIMRKLQLKEKKLELDSTSNFLERWKLSMGISKASFKAEKFKTQLQESRQVELLKKCLDYLVAGLIIMLFSLGYGTYVYSHRRIIEATEACSPYTESKSWWMPKSMATINSGLQLLKCQIQVLSRMLFGVLMIGAIAFLLIQRSSTSHQTMPVTFILLLLGILCGYAGKFCVDTLGGNGSHWLIYWESLCLLHFLSNTFHSSLYFILNGPITTVVERVEGNTVYFSYWIRRTVFFSNLLVIPLLCGLMPFAGPWEWFAHFQSRASDFLTFDDD